MPSCCDGIDMVRLHLEMIHVSSLQANDQYSAAGMVSLFSWLSNYAVL